MLDTPRPWVSRSGASAIEASVEGYGPEYVIFKKKADGARAWILRSRLSEEDQQLIVQVEAVLHAESPAVDAQVASRGQPSSAPTARP